MKRLQGDEYPGRLGTSGNLAFPIALLPVDEAVRLGLEDEEILSSK
jgi:hypothetical protein